MSGRGQHALDRGQSLGNEQGDGFEGLAGDKDQQVIAPGHQVAGFDLLELGDAQGHAIESPSRSGLILTSITARNFFRIGLLGVEDRHPSENGLVLPKFLEFSLHILFVLPKNLGEAFGTGVGGFEKQ